MPAARRNLTVDCGAKQVKKSQKNGNEAVLVNCDFNLFQAMDHCFQMILIVCVFKG